MAFLIHSWVYLVVIFLACLFAILASAANVSIHYCGLSSGWGGGGIAI